MRFVSPVFLYALAAIAVPIIIHLFNFRKFKKVFFTNVRFLKEVRQETQSKSKIKHLLVLFCRILAITFLVFAFAQPFIPQSGGKVASGNTAISIYIDNSFSMEAVNKNGSLLDEAKKRAQEIVASYKPTDRFQLLTNDFEGRHQRLVNKEEFNSLLEEVKISPAVKSISEVSSRQLDVLNGNNIKNKKAFIVSDFQKSIANIGEIKNDTSVQVLLYQAKAQQSNNVYIDSCWFNTPVRQAGKTEQLNVRIKNTSNNAVENNSVKLFINEQQKTPASYTVEANSQKDISLSFASREIGIQNCRVEISDYPVTFDDKFFLSFEVAQRIPVMSINSSEAITRTNTGIDEVFNDSLFLFTSSDEKKLDYASLKNNSLIVLNELKTISSGLAQELNRFVKNGGSLLVFPNAQSDLPSYSVLLNPMNIASYQVLDTVNTRVDKINYEQEIFRDVFEKKDASMNLPFVSRHYKLGKSTRSNEEYIMKLQNGDAFLNKSNVGKGKVYLCSSPLDEESGNFTRHALFLPALFRIAIYSQAEQTLFYTINKDDVVETSNRQLTNESVYHINDAYNGTFDIIPEHKAEELKTTLLLHGQVTNAGNYFLALGKEKVTGLSFNYNRKESNLYCYTSEELVQQYETAGFSNFRMLENGAKSLTQTLSESFQDKKLWKLCIVLVLIFLGIEVLLLRFMK